MGGGHRHPPQANNVWYGEGMRKAKLTVLLVVGEGSFAQPLLIVTQRQKCVALMLLTAFFHSSHRQNFLPPLQTPSYFNFPVKTASTEKATGPETSMKISPD